ncbi:MAG: hypothetical protein AAFW70_16600 [Cyanobacteria bacterium J06635_10]
MLNAGYKRVIIATGDARVGKSTCLKLLVDLLRSQNKSPVLYDFDKRDKFKGYHKYIPVCDNLNFFKGNTDLILDDIEEVDASVILVDMPGQYVSEMLSEIEDCYFFEQLACRGWQVTFLQPISHRFDCIYYLKQIMDYSGNLAKYVVVKNLCFDKYFIEFEKEVSQQLYQLGGITITLDQLQQNVYQAIDSLDIPYQEACNSSRLFLLYRSYLYRWMKSFNQQLLSNNLVSEYLGIYSQPVIEAEEIF